MRFDGGEHAVDRTAARRRASTDGGAPRRCQKLVDCIATAESRELILDELIFAASEEPNTFEEANHDPAWLAAMEEKLNAIVDNGTWSLVDLPTGHRPIGLKWVYKLKKDATGDVILHKARLVAKGYIQRAGVDFEEVFAPVARLDSVRALVAVAVHEACKIHHLDVKSAFLNEDLAGEVYVVQPPGFSVAGHELRQAPRVWNLKLDSTLVKLGFNRCSEEHGVYTRGNGLKRLLLEVYDEDMIVTKADQVEFSTFKEEMQQALNISDSDT